MSEPKLSDYNLAADEVMRLRVQIAAPHIVGPTGQGWLQVIPIVGGTFTGNGMNGRVVPGGADWNTTREDGVVHVFAKYLLQTSDGEYIAIENEGWLARDTAARIKTHPTFAASTAGNYAHLNCGTYVGELTVPAGVPDVVDIVIYKLR